MDNLYFFPTINSKMREECGLNIGGYKFTYTYNGEWYELQQKGKTTLKLSDPLDIWNIETEGLTIEKTVRIAYPDLLKGPEGVSCRGADLGLCIIWTNKKLTQTGHILPIEEHITPLGWTCEFNYTFNPKTVMGDLELDLIMYIKQKAEKVLDDEWNLINETGVTVGELEKVILDFNSIYMEFPIEEYKSEDMPLWWVEISNWEDPKTVDMFSRDSFCLYLNPYYDACPAPSTSVAGSGIKNFDLLVDILAQTYMLLFKRLTDDELRDTINDIGLVPGTICSVLNQFYDSCIYENLIFDPPEMLLRGLQINIRKILQEDSP